MKITAIRSCLVDASPPGGWGGGGRFVVCATTTAQATAVPSFIVVG